MRANRGAAFVVILVLMLVLGVIGVAFLTISVNSMSAVNHQKSWKQAYYLAYSGANAVVRYLSQHPNDVESMAENTSTATFPVDYDNSLGIPGGEYHVETFRSYNGTTSDPTDDTYRITGIGKVETIERRTTATVKRARLSDVIDGAIYSTANLDISGMQVIGSVQSAGTIFPPNNIVDEEEDIPNGESKYLFGEVIPDEPKFFSIDWIDPSLATEMGNINIANNALHQTDLSSGGVFYIPKIKVGGSNSPTKGWEIIIGNSHVDLIVDELETKGNILINATGSGSLNLFITSEFDSQTSGIINQDESSRLFVFLNAGSVLTDSSGMQFNGYIIGPEANIYIKSSNTNIIGAVYGNALFGNINAGTENNDPGGSVEYKPLDEDDGNMEFFKAFQVVKWE